MDRFVRLVHWGKMFRKVRSFDSLSRCLPMGTAAPMSLSRARLAPRSASLSCGQAVPRLKREVDDPSVCFGVSIGGDVDHATGFPCPPPLRGAASLRSLSWMEDGLAQSRRGRRLG